MNLYLSRLREGDEQALSQLMDSYFVPLCDFCNWFIDDMAVSEELVADVFYTIWSKRTTLEIHTSLKSYLYTSVKNKALQKKRNLSTSRSVPLDSITSEAVEPDNALTQIMLRELNSDIVNLVQTLPEKRRVIFELNRFESLTYKEIATLLQVSEKTVRNQMSLAIKYLRPRVSLLLNNIS
jgi:RNA polymerase sigma-70 factor (ECF subfamily)